MSLLVVGLSHRSAPVSVLERATLHADAQTKLLQDTVAAEPAAEAAVLATCNRIELYADVDKFHAGVAELSTLLAQHSGVGLDELTPYLYVHYEDRAVHHLFSVACGLDSMVVGEGQILGQMKDSLARAQDLHTAGRLLNDLFQQALRVGKRAHSETGIDRAGQSLVTFGLEQLAAGGDDGSVGDWARGKRALVIGAGSMSSLAAATLARVGVAEIVIANRTDDRAQRLAQILTEAPDLDVSARAVPMDSVPHELTRADIAVSCTGATGLVLATETVAGAVAGRVTAPGTGLPVVGAPDAVAAGGSSATGRAGAGSGDTAVSSASAASGTSLSSAGTGVPGAAVTPGLPGDSAVSGVPGDSGRSRPSGAAAASGLPGDSGQFRSSGAFGEAGPVGAPAERELPATSLGAEDGCPLDLPGAPVDLPAVPVTAGFSVLGEDAVAGMAAAELEQHAAWVDNAPRPQSSSAPGPQGVVLDPAQDVDAITALAAAAALLGRIPERRKPEPVVEPPRPAPVLFLLDLAMPRDIDAGAHRLAGVRLVDIESLAEASADAPMAADVDQVRRIVSDEVEAFGAALRAAHITPTVVALRTMAADVVASEVARLEGRLPGLDERHRAEINQTVKRVVDKLLHAPTVRVKQLAAEPGGAGYADALRTLFDLDQETVASVSRAGRADEGADDDPQYSKNRGPA